mmetsp:Transcript_32118/g.61855  ORF Transcript_32118/g.61855 Transcript_32118/m.61855 type:complete len:332 (+) Transcript_32118:287-1282(+)
MSCICLIENSNRPIRIQPDNLALALALDLIALIPPVPTSRRNFHPLSLLKMLRARTILIPTPSNPPSQHGVQRQKCSIAHDPNPKVRCMPHCNSIYPIHPTQHVVKRHADFALIHRILIKGPVTFPLIIPRMISPVSQQFIDHIPQNVIDTHPLPIQKIIQFPLVGMLPPNSIQFLYALLPPGQIPRPHSFAHPPVHEQRLDILREMRDRPTLQPVPQNGPGTKGIQIPVLIFLQSLHGQHAMFGRDDVRDGEAYTAIHAELAIGGEGWHESDGGVGVVSVDFHGGFEEEVEDEIVLAVERTEEMGWRVGGFFFFIVVRCKGRGRGRGGIE